MRSEAVIPPDPEPEPGLEPEPGAPPAGGVPPVVGFGTVAVVVQAALATAMSKNSSREISRKIFSRCSLLRFRKQEPLYSQPRVVGGRSLHRTGSYFGG